MTKMSLRVKYIVFVNTAVLNRLASAFAGIDSLHQLFHRCDKTGDQEFAFFSFSFPPCTITSSVEEKHFYFFVHEKIF